MPLGTKREPVCQNKRQQRKRKNDHRLEEDTLLLCRATERPSTLNKVDRAIAIDEPLDRRARIAVTTVKVVPSFHKEAMLLKRVCSALLYGASCRNRPVGGYGRKHPIYGKKGISLPDRSTS